MQYYDPEDIRRDYLDSYLVSPYDGLVRLLADVNRQGVCTLQGKSDNQTVRADELDWKHVGIPRLGYRNITSRGKDLVYFQRKVGRNTYKGLNHQTVSTILVPQVQSTMTELAIDSADYRVLPSQRWAFNRAEAIFKPDFVPNIAEAVIVLESNGFATGFALNHDLAIVLGPRKHNAFVLLWKQHVAATSPNGERWRVSSLPFRDILSRQLKDILYAK